MIYWGINALNHGSSLSVFKNGKFISNKFDRTDELESQTIRQALDIGAPDRIFWYERPWIKKARQLRAGQWKRAFDLDVLPRTYLNRSRLHYAPVTYTPHHASHAAAGYYTSPFDQCAIVVLDAIGEFECATIWQAQHGKIKKIWSRTYPNSLGLFYSAFTHLIGLTPIQEEFKLQQLSEQGDYTKYYNDVKNYFTGILDLNRNLHKGVVDWPYTITEEDKPHIAAAVQCIFEEQLSLIMTVVKSLTGADSLVYMGGCAMNSKANKLIVEPKFKYIWSLPNPGDPSSSIGAVLYHTQQRLAGVDFGVVKHIKINV